MTRNDFSSLGSSAFSAVVAKRQAKVAADRKADEILDACQCANKCKCGAWDKANAVISAAHHELMAAEEMWREYCEVRNAA